MTRQRQIAVTLLDQLYGERQRLNNAIYHIRRHVLGLNYKRAHKLIKAAREMEAK